MNHSKTSRFRRPRLRLPHLRLPTRIYSGIGLLSALFLVSIFCSLWGTSRVLRNGESLLAAEESAELLQRIHLQVIDLERVVTAYVASGNNSNDTEARRIKHKLETLLQQSLDGTHSEETLRRLQKMKQLMASYRESYEFLVEERKLRESLVKGKLFGLGGKLQRQITDLQKIFEIKENKHLQNLLERGADAFSYSERMMLRYLIDPDSLKSRDVLNSLDTALGEFERACDLGSEQDQAELDSILANTREYRSIALRTTQATRGYLAIVNVVLAGQASEFLYQAQKVQELTDARLELIAKNNRIRASETLSLTLGLGGTAMCVGIFIAWLFIRSIVQPITKITDTFIALSQGEDVSSIPGLERSDDIGDLARAANVFRSRNRQTVRDASALREKNIEIEKLATEFKRLAREANVANEAKSEFLANMSHEIRTPMTAINGFSELLCEQSETPELREAASTILRNGTHLLDIINDILDLSKIESGKMTVEKIRCPVHDIVKDVEQLMRVRSEAKNIELRVSVVPETPSQFESDPTRLRQILVNLVGNAIKFTELGCVDMQVRYESDSNLMRFEITDTGIGMTEDQMARLFKPFNQADNTMSRRFGGTGLGLSICKRLSGLLGGDIAVSSTHGLGSVFSVTVDAGAVEYVTPPDTRTRVKVSSVNTNATVSATRNEEKRLGGFRIMLAEDGPDNQRLIGHVLTKAGAELEIVDNGEKAVHLALEKARQNKPFDVLLIDMQMPVMDGYQAATELRRANYQGQIIALTAHAMAHDRQKCIDAGCTDYQSKPIDRIALIDACLVACNASRAELIDS